MAKKQAYDNESITMLKGPDKVRKRPGVIFGSDGLDGCAHSVFEIISNSIDEARAGYGSKIVVTRYQDNSIEVEDFGRGCPVDFNKNENRYNWELVYCELYAGGKYNSNDDNYAYSLGLNGPGLLFVGSFLITVSISALVVGPFIFSISSWFSLGILYFPKNLSISSRFSILLAYSCI